MRPALRMKIHPGRPAGKEGPSQSHGERQVAPAHGAGGVDEFQWQEHGDSQDSDQREDDPEIRPERKEHDDQHIPTAGKALEGVIGGFHAVVTEIHGAGKGDHDDCKPSGPPRQEARLEQGKGGNEDVGQVVDDQVKQHTVKARCVGFDIVFARQGPVDAIDGKGHNQPQKHQRPLFAGRCQHRKHGKNGTGGGEEVNEEGAGLNCHVPVMNEIVGRRKQAVSPCRAQCDVAQVGNSQGGVKFPTGGMQHMRARERPGFAGCQQIR